MLAASLLLLASAEDSPHFPGATMCCNWRTKPHVSTPSRPVVGGVGLGWGWAWALGLSCARVQECGIGVCTKAECSWLCHAECACAAPGWMPPSWAADVAAGSLLPAAPDNPGGTISNGYVGAWVPRGLPGSAGSPVCGAEHVKGVFAPASSSNGALYGYSNATKVQLAALGSWTATAFLASIGTAKLPATASAMDFRRAAYRVASKAGDVECVQSIYAHRSRPHLLISEFECENKGAADATVTVDQGRCNPLSLVDDYIYETLCPRTNGSQHGYVREARPSGMAVSCHDIAGIWVAFVSR